MKFLRKILGLVLVVGVIVGVVRGVGEIESKSKSKSKSEEKLTYQQETEEPIRFAVMSDIHSDWENFRKALEKAKEGFRPASVPPAGGTTAGKGFVIITGDLTTLGKKSELLEAKKILDESGLKYYVVPGNHDIWMGRKYEQDLWGEVFEDSFQSFKNNGYKFILVNNGDGEGGVGWVRGVGDIREMEWLKRETEECVRVYCLVFLHEPLNHPNSQHVMGEENPEVASEAAQLIKLFVDNKVQEVFAGHLHFSSSYKLGGLKTTIVGAVSSDRNFQSPKFLEVIIKDDNLEKRDVFLGE